MNDDNNNLAQKKTEIKFHNNDLTDKLNVFSNRNNNLLEQIRANSLLYDDLFKNKDEILTVLKSNIDETMKNRIDLEIKKSALNHKTSCFKKYNFYCPNDVLLQIKNILSEHNIATITGCEWLNEQSLSEIEAKKLLNTHPLLPFSIIIENTQLNNITNCLKSNKLFKKIHLIFQLSFLLKMKLKLKTKIQKICLFHWFIHYISTNKNH